MKDFIDLKGEELKDAVLNTEWYTKGNDLIGGWCIMPIDELPSRGCVEVADFLCKEHAEHITNLHNEWFKNGR